jgi:YidC/Oxa1 family membrane protein insertase
MDTQRLILFVIFSFSALLLWEAWQKESRPPPAPVVASPAGKPAGPADLPAVPAAP